MEGEQGEKLSTGRRVREGWSRDLNWPGKGRRTGDSLWRTNRSGGGRL